MTDVRQIPRWAESRIRTTERRLFDKMEVIESYNRSRTGRNTGKTFSSDSTALKRIAKLLPPSQRFDWQCQSADSGIINGKDLSGGWDIRDARGRLARPRHFELMATRTLLIAPFIISKLPRRFETIDFSALPSDCRASELLPNDEGISGSI
jgi:hypothetical protein